ncbi:proto-oncogene Mas-like isoform X2 [Protopterus annectens]|nr:proto-oncogene Mas-like isoform X2 [Protopterus annectens]XP_043914787.1 proto-oncogene Mas-like isoform X2 [Protopterus annectens]
MDNTSIGPIFMLLTSSGWKGQAFNESSENKLPSTLFFFCWITIATVGLLGNGIIIWFLSLKIQRTHFAVLILNLSVADFLYLICNTIAAFIRISGSPIEDTTIYNTVKTISQYIPYNVGLLLMTAISIERCTCLIRPVWYRFHRSNNFSAIVAALIWVFCIFIVVIPNIIDLINCPYSVMQDDPYKTSQKSFSALLLYFLILYFALLFPITLICTLIVVCKMQKDKSARRAKVNAVMVASIIAFVIFSGPFSLVIFIIRQKSKSSYTLRLVYAGFRILHIIGCSINPFIYIFLGRDMKKFKLTILQNLRRVFTTETSHAEKDESVTSKTENIQI